MKSLVKSHSPLEAAFISKLDVNNSAEPNYNLTTPICDEIGQGSIKM